MSTERYSVTLVSDNINTPIITLKASNTNISVDQKVDFAVSAKNILGTDLADKAEYKWDYNGDGFYEETTNTPTVSHVYDKPGNFNFKVKVTYKGISNTKNQAITVKNVIVPNLEYIAIGKKFIFLNTTKGLYTKVKWTLGDTISTTTDSFTYDFGENDVSGDLTLEVSDGTDTKSTSTGLRKDIINALRVKKSTDKLVYFTYPSADSDIVHITNSTDKLYVYLGESKASNVTKYGIDTDISVDSNLNGDPADDIDNKGTDSSIKGNVFAIKNIDVMAKEKTMRLSLYDTNNTVIATKDIKVMYDFVTATSTEVLAGSGSESLPKDISEADKVNLEKLKDLIKGAKEQDRLKMMQFFAQLQENWFDTREKTKTIIDFEGYIDNSSALDTAAKDSFYSLLEGFLLSDTQVKDEVGLATKVLKSLIPKTNPSYEQIMKNIDDIISHPTNTTLNKELGTFILNAIKDDTTIEVKDKNIIKSQLQTIIYGGQNNIPANAPAVESTTNNSSGILDFLLGFGKILGFVFLSIALLIIGSFVYFKAFNKDENLGFQDFIIDKMAGKKSVEKPSFVPSVSSVETPVIKKEERPQVDVLASIAPATQSLNTSSSDETKISNESISTPSLPPTEASIPSWLKESTSLSSESTTDEVGSPNSEDAPVEKEDAIIPEVPVESVDPVPETSINDSSSAGLPDWLKGSGMESITPEVPETDVVPEDITPENLITSEESPLPDVVPENTSDENLSDLPAWMQGIDQESLKEEVEEEIKATPVVSESDSSSSYEDIPDWLKASPVVSEVVETPKNEEKTKEPPMSDFFTEKKEEKKTPSQHSHKKQAKPVEKEKQDNYTSKSEEKVHTPRPKKKKPTPVVSE